MSQPEAWTPEEAERLRKIANGECLHEKTVESWSVWLIHPDIICWDCSAFLHEGESE